MNTLKRLILSFCFLFIIVGCEMDPSLEQAPGVPSQVNENNDDNSSTENADGEPSVSILDRLASQEMYSTEATGCASWLFPDMYTDENQVRLSRAMIATPMEESGDDRFPVITIYQCLHCGGFDEDGYLAWIEELAVMISEKPGDVVLVIEPDTFAMSANDDEMNDILDKVCGIIADNAENAAVFLDIGHSGWIDAEGVFELVSQYENYDKIDGWASNTSNFQPMELEELFADELYELTDKPVIIDTSRNGCGIPSTIYNPADDEWCPGDEFSVHEDNPAILFNYYNKPSDEED
ncbi:MAG: glycoside hydrolase family 6 protein [Deltaproteobacteria bacterium]|nr:glycoside hydrolase family 6 protein [Deltaproteobacteria bacterium]MBN2673497.1 glycoside hydrolase family 6 protein [Deltaproteobacteria bacterium]